jgi:hypothetical protein
VIASLVLHQPDRVVNEGRLVIMEDEGKISRDLPEPQSRTKQNYKPEKRISSHVPIDSRRSIASELCLAVVD